MSSLERLRSSRAASSNSFSLRLSFLSGVRKKFFTTCCVMVEAPSRLRPENASTTTARAIAIGLNPGCL